MDLIEVKPSTHLNFTLPHSTSAKVTLYNITLHQLNLRIYTSHPSNFIITPSQFSMDSFDEKTIKIQLKYYQQSSVSNFLTNKMVLYVYDYDQEGQVWHQNGIHKDKFNKVHKIEFQISCTADMQHYCLKQPQTKELMLRMCKQSEGVMTSKDKSKLIAYLEGLGSLENFYSLAGDVFLAKYKTLSKTASEIMELESSNEQIVIYSIGSHPWMIYPKDSQQINLTRKKSHSQSSNPKAPAIEHRQSFNEKHPSPPPQTQVEPQKQEQNLPQQEQKQQQKQVNPSLQDQLEPIQKQQQANEMSKESFPQLENEHDLDSQAPFRQGIRLSSRECLDIEQNSTKKIFIEQKFTITEQELSKVLKQDTTATTNNKSKRKNNFESFVYKQAKGSFSSKRGKRRNKSMEIKARKTSEDIQQEDDQEEDENYKGLFMENQSQPHQKLSLKSDEPLLENVQIINSIIKPLNMLLIGQNSFAILFQGFVMLYSSIEKVGAGQKIELGPLLEWKTKKTVLKCTDSRLVVSCNNSYFIIDLKKKKVTSGYVQRKEILDFLIHEKNNILILGGITYSKLSLFGKQTGRSNIKTYSLQNQYHLYTFDFPDQGDIYHLGQLGITDSKMVAALGNNNKVSILYFVNVVNATKMEFLSKFQMEELAVSDIKQLKLVERSIYILQDLKSEETPLMFVKKFNIKFQDRPSISTQSLPIPHSGYSYLAMDKQVILLVDPLNKVLLIYVIKNRKHIKMNFQNKFVKMEVNFPYLFIMYDTHIQVKRLHMSSKYKV